MSTRISGLSNTAPQCAATQRPAQDPKAESREIPPSGASRSSVPSPSGPVGDLVNLLTTSGRTGNAGRFAELAAALGVASRGSGGPAWFQSLTSDQGAMHRSVPASPLQTGSALGASLPARPGVSAVGPMSGGRTAQQMDDPPQGDQGAGDKGIWDTVVSWVKSIVQSDQDAINTGAAAQSTAGKAAGATAGTVAGAAQTVLTANTNSPSEKHDEFVGWISILKSRERGSGHEQMPAYQDVLCEPYCPPPDAGPTDQGNRTPDPNDEGAPANAGEAAAREKLREVIAAAQLGYSPLNRAEGRAGIENPTGAPGRRPGELNRAEIDAVQLLGASPRTGNQTNPDPTSDGSTSHEAATSLRLKLGGAGVADPFSGPADGQEPTAF